MSNFFMSPKIPLSAPARYTTVLFKRLMLISSISLALNSGKYSSYLCQVLLKWKVLSLNFCLTFTWKSVDNVDWNVWSSRQKGLNTYLDIGSALKAASADMFSSKLYHHRRSPTGDVPLTIVTSSQGNKWKQEKCKACLSKSSDWDSVGKLHRHAVNLEHFMGCQAKQKLDLYGQFEKKQEKNSNIFQQTSKK